MATEDTFNPETDLPLMANTSDFLVYHYIIDVTCDLEAKVLHGSITLFLDSKRSKRDCVNKQVFSIHEYQCMLSGKTDCTLCGCQKYNNRYLHQAPQDDASLKDVILSLESHSLVVDHVSEILLPECDASQLYSRKGLDLRTNEQFYLDCLKNHTADLRYSVDKWCLKIWKPGVLHTSEFPRIVKIDYRTQPEGTSLRWATDQEGRRCMYTAAMWVNNRAMMPCQEYGSFSTWQAYVKTPEDACLVMSGDTSAKLIKPGYWYQSSRMPLPSFALALAIGYWQSVSLTSIPATDTEWSGSLSESCEHDPACFINYIDSLPCTLYAPGSMLERGVAEWGHYMTRVASAVQRLLGPFPFSRVDLVLYPPCSQDMAMASPNMIFVSQSLLDGSLCVKLAHELTHAWFGLLIGARDWTEEWLSEGFATYMEDQVHALAMGWSDEYNKEYSQLRALLRYRTLQAELQNTDTSVQILRPNKEIADKHEFKFVKNGLNPAKLFTQVHYLKGYFLLCYLAELVGRDRFDQMIKDYIKRHHGRLVLSRVNSGGSKRGGGAERFISPSKRGRGTGALSQGPRSPLLLLFGLGNCYAPSLDPPLDFLSMASESFPEIRSEIENVHEDWLDVPGMPKKLENWQANPENSLIVQVQQEVSLWKPYWTKNTAKQKRRGGKLKDPRTQTLNGDQVIMLLEEILDWSPVAGGCVLASLNRCYSLSQHNAEVRHRWCELVIKHKYRPAYGDVRSFLINDQAMGVYLYGELMISQCQHQRKLAHECFSETGGAMEKTTHDMVYVMLNGHPPPAQDKEYFS